MKNQETNIQRNYSKEFHPYYSIGKKPNKEGLFNLECILRVQRTFRSKENQYTFKTNILIKPDYWDKETESIKVSDEQSQEAFIKLKELHAKILEIRAGLKAKGIVISPQTILSKLNNNIDDYPSLLNVYRKFVADKQSQIELTYKTRYRYFKRLALIQLYINTVLKQTDIDIEDVKIKFVENYMAWLKTERKQAHDFACKEIECLKAVIDFAIRQEFYDRANVIRSFKIRRQNKPIIKFLTIEQVNRLYNTTFDNEALNIVKDGFLFQCFTGLAHVDLINVCKENIYANQNDKVWLSIERKKTSTRATIPLIKEALEIIEKYKDFKDHKKYRLAGAGLIPVFSNSMMNKLLKQIGLLKNIPLDVMCCHSGRKSFAMACLNNGKVSIETVSNMLGHSNTTITQKYYAKVTTGKIEREMADFNYFPQL